MIDLTVNEFRRRRGAVLRKRIDEAFRDCGRDIVILDVGGRPDYWENVDPGHVRKIILLNIGPLELSRDSRLSGFESMLGDACDLSAFEDSSVDLVHSNSVIEHVGGWSNIRRMAREVRRVGRHGWVQTPAWECPLEPHFRFPIIHWFARPTQARLLSLIGRFRGCSIVERRNLVEEINLLTKQEFASLFPGASLFVERLAWMPKSYTAWW
ncbi:hypothetical+protein [Methylocapsa aurea]|jgi:hypothetical protein|uniref:methyltransferase domain-containing protein n=1 Tax=Methylocapsa aurea TaxID=663610 RepID=UPI003D18E7F3